MEPVLNGDVAKIGNPICPGNVHFRQSDPGGIEHNKVQNYRRRSLPKPAARLQVSERKYVIEATNVFTTLVCCDSLELNNRLLTMLRTQLGKMMRPRSGEIFLNTNPFRFILQIAICTSPLGLLS